MRGSEVFITIDVEEDCPPYLKTTRGMEEGLPRLLDLFEERGIQATFFFTGEMAERFPDLVREVVKRGHELGSHGYHHRRLDKVSLEEARREIEESLSVLRRFYPVVSFRAPNLQLPDELFPVLEKNGIRVDSSKARYKGWKKGVARIGRLLEVPVSVTSSVLRLPWWIQKVIHRRLSEPRVYFVHPWEFVKMRGVRPDCSFNTGEKALELLEKVIDFYDRLSFDFLTLRELLNLDR